MGKKETTQRMLADSLLKLAASKPVDKITIREIVEYSGVSSQTFYNYFDNKYELVLWIHKSYGDELMSAFEKGEITFREMTLKNLTFYGEHASFMINALTNTTGQDSYWVTSSENAIGLFEKCICRKSGRDKLTEMEKIHIRMYTYATTEIYAHWAMNGMKISKEQMADYVLAARPQSLMKYLE